jgi:hypothetical protein
MQSASRFQIRQLLRESVRQARESPHLHPHRKILTLNMAGTNPASNSATTGACASSIFLRIKPRKFAKPSIGY